MTSVFSSVLSDDDVEEAHPMDGNDSDYDPKKEAKKEVTDSLTVNVSLFGFCESVTVENVTCSKEASLAAC